MSAALIVDLQGAIAAGDKGRVAEIAWAALSKLSPSGALAEIAARADANRAFDALAKNFDALATHFDDDERAVAHLEREGLLDQLEDDFALLAPTLADNAQPLLAWAIPLLSALAGPGAPFLSFGLQIACKVALAALKAWAAKRASHIPAKPVT